MGIKTLLQSHHYFGRGMIVGKSSSADKAFLLYFIMGRSENSQNRLFYLNGKEVCIVALNAEKIADSSLIFYPPLIHFQNFTILGNGDQTKTILQSLKNNESFEEALRKREFEPDTPHFTPRISALLAFEKGDFFYKMSLIKSFQTHFCHRFFYEYPSTAGWGHFLHTYSDDSHPLPSFIGEPKPIRLSQSLRDLATEVWENLYKDYRVALCAQSINLCTQEIETLIINKE